MRNLSKPAKASRILLLIFGLVGVANLFGQRERTVQPATEAPYSRRFFAQLRGVFGRFREADLREAFEKAQPIQCSELVNDKGEWRTVAFFNEKRELGDWYRASLEEVKSDLAVFIFSGVCRGDRGVVQLTTKFPVAETIEAYNQNRIGLDEVEVNVNAPVRASFDTPTQAYTFDLPYLFLVRQLDGQNVYSLDPPRLIDRDQYAADVTDHWECKSVIGDAVTYQFLICRTSTVPSDAFLRRQVLAPTFGASAYFILSDGKEAASSVTLTFKDASDTDHPVEDASKADLSDASPERWEVPDSDERIVNLVRDPFRIRFAAAPWTGRIGAAQVLSGGRLTSLASSNPASGADYCVWLPGAAGSVQLLLANDSEERVGYSVKIHDPDGQSSASVAFDMRTSAGIQIGSLECFFPRTSSIASLPFSRWASSVGDHLTFEIRP